MRLRGRRWVAIDPSFHYGDSARHIFMAEAHDGMPARALRQVDGGVLVGSTPALP